MTKSDRATSLYPTLQRQLDSLKRRSQVLEGLWSGKSVKEIEAEMGISHKTIEWHRAELFRAFGVHDLISLCRKALREGILKP